MDADADRGAEEPLAQGVYERLRSQGKLPKVALVASMHKLLGAVHSVARRRQPFVRFLQGAQMTT